MSNRDYWKQVEEIFHRVLGGPQGERAERLDQACEGNTQLRADVESLLAHHDDRGTFLNTPAIRELDSDSLEATELPTRIGPYRVIDRLGRGGMGEVYLAEQSGAIQRRVAIKVIRAGMDSEQVIARFESERQALATMDHPNVAKIFDAGATEDGRPYFAMEYVEGEHITEHCARREVGLEARLELFVSVCLAIHHAHQKGIIHRDIKPSNVLVTMVDGVHVPKVIDFGVAKAMQQDMDQGSILTLQGVLVGTPAYMSPEQADASDLNIDTTSDVYSLGVMLYELLVGAQPFDDRELRQAGLARMHRILRETEPPKPSSRLETLESTASSPHKTNPRSWRKLVRGELDWITMQAMAKERGRRYQSADALAEDVRRYLRHDAVLASPPSRTYRLRKLMGRHTAASAFAATLFLFVVAFGISMGLLRGRAESARVAALERAAELERVTQFQSAMLSSFDPEASGSNLYSDLLVDMKASLSGNDVEDAAVDSMTLEFERMLRRVNSTDVASRFVDEEFLARAARTLATDFEGQPLVRAALQQTLADVYRSIGRYPPGLALQEAALETRRSVLGADHPLTIEATNRLGDLYYSMGELEEASSCYRQALERSRTVLGPDHPETLQSLTNMGEILHASEQMDEAYPVVEEALAEHRRVLGGQHPETLIALNNMGSLQLNMGKPQEALVYYEESVQAQRTVLGDDHPETLNSINNLAFALQQVGELERAAELYREALEGRRRVLGDTHPKTLISVMGTAYVLKALGRLEEAQVYYLEGLEGRRAALGNEHPKTEVAMTLVASNYKSLGQLDESARYYREAIESMRRTRGEDNPATLTVTNNIGSLLMTMGRLDEALVYLRRAHAGCQRAAGDQHPVTLQSVILIGGVLLEQGKARESVEWLAGKEPDARAGFVGKNSYKLGVYLTALGESRTAAGQYPQAAADLSEGEEILTGSTGNLGVHRQDNLQAQATLYDSWNEARPGQGHDATARELRARIDAQ